MPRPRRRRRSRSWRRPRRSTTIASIARGRAGPTGQARKIRALFPGDAASASIVQLLAKQRCRAPPDRRRSSTEIPTTMVMEELPVPRPTHVLIRGQYDQPGARVAPGVPGCLSPWPDGAKPDRLGLARWLVDPANPLTARVAVNRDWQMLFGTGLVKTVDDFGAQGEPRAIRSCSTGWRPSLSAPAGTSSDLLRLMVTSATYRQSSRATPRALKRDPDNRLLARARGCGCRPR